MKKTLRCILFMLMTVGIAYPGLPQLVAAVGTQQKANPSQPATTSLKAALQEFKTHYKVDILYFDNIVKGYEVPLSALNFGSGSEKALENLLKPFDLSYRKAKTGGYIITKTQKSGNKGKNALLLNKSIQSTEQTNVDLTTSLLATDQSAPALAAEIQIKGKISDENGLGLPGVSVVLKGSRQGTVTDEEGNYQFQVPDEDAALVFSFVGYLSQEIIVGKKTAIDIVLRPDTKALEELVVTGYSSQKRSLLSGSVVTMNMTDDLQNVPTTSAANLLAGRLAGVDITTPLGIPGTAPGITIRTRSSLNSQPVTFVIDGVIRDETDFNNLSPNEIETVSVLKDASAAAIYGSRSAGGVILVTTKRGNVGKPTFNYSFNTGFDSRTKNAALTNAVQAGELYMRINGTADPAGWAWSQEELDHFKTINNGYGYDQLDAVWRNPSTSQHNLGVTGGSEKIRYFAGASYVKQNGFLKPLTFDKYNIRLNATIDATKDLQFFVGLGVSNNLQSNVTWEGPQSMYKKLRVWQPDQPVYTDSGKLIDYGWVANVGGTVNGDGGYSRSHFLKPQIVLNATYNIPVVKGLSAKAAYSRNYDYNREKVFQKNYTMNVMKREGVNGHIIHTDDASIVSTKLSSYNSKDFLRTNITWSQDYQLDLQLTYENTFRDRHHVQGIVVYEKAEQSGSDIFAGRESFPVYTTDQWWAASGTRADDYGGGGTDFVNGRVSYIGQLNYDYDEKYLLNFSFREDGSMNFAPDKRWGFFPAGSVGWVISKESFFPKSTGIDLLKFRTSAGLTGNDAVGGWQWEESYRQGNSAYFGTSPSRFTSITYGPVVNPNLTWEKALTYNVAADVNFLKNWSATIEYWNRKSYDILGQRVLSVPPTFSLTLPAENYGEIKAQGFDFSLGYRKSKNAFTYYGNLTMSYGWNKIIKQDYAQNAQSIDIPVGQSLTVIKGWQFDKIIRTQSDLDQFNAEHPGYNYNGIAPALGMMVYKDLSGPNGVSDGIVDTYDRVVIKANNFPLVYGLNLGGSWKGISVDLMFNGYLNQQKSYRDLAGGVEWNRMYDEWYDNSWTPENTNAKLPKRMSASQSNTYDTPSDFWYQNAGFARLKYLNVGYTLPKKFYGHVLDGVKLYFSGTNLFSLTGFSHYDPEIGDGFSYPVMRSFNFGINVSF